MAANHPVFRPPGLDENGELLLPPYGVGGHVDDHFINPRAPPAPPIDHLRLDDFTAQNEHGTAARTRYAPLQYNLQNPALAHNHHTARPLTPPRTHSPPLMPHMVPPDTTFIHQDLTLAFQEHALPSRRYHNYIQQQNYAWTPDQAMGVALAGDNILVGAHTWLLNSYDVSDFTNFGDYERYVNGGAPVAPTPVPVARPQPSVTPSAATTRYTGPLVCRRPGCEDKTFDQRSTLRKHLINHLPEYYRPYGCSKPPCTDRFWFPKDILRHDYNKHQGVYTACPYCYTSFLGENQNETEAKKAVLAHIASNHKDSRGVENMSLEDVLAVLATVEETMTVASSARSPSTVMSPDMVFSPAVDSMPDTPFTGPNTLFGAPMTPYNSHPTPATPSRGPYRTGPNYGNDQALNDDVCFKQEYTHE